MMVAVRLSDRIQGKEPYFMSIISFHDLKGNIVIHYKRSSQKVMAANIFIVSSFAVGTESTKT